ncbi:HDOD domain-containing protein [Thermosulfurimonas sp. F29]|uniref:HDOD domain-containing protein n=1 Tax=Thermosulfurimonas sp. F29 TaxID=2867247 RepID=UPI001C83BF4E|nr:HDOD domain-containing protein [Thermosulfurimonas sp. F29]MBX6422911.1 HDOD domain-containing protein [Thermosulfurimonas sp. F29]
MGRLDCSRYEECFRRLSASYEVVAELERAFRSEHTNFDELARVIEKDPALTAEILKVVNSPYYGFPRKISSVAHGVVLLGMVNIRIIVLTVSFFKSHPRLTPLWAHSQWVSYLAKELLKRLLKTSMRQSPLLLAIDPTTLATAGILHDVGKIPRFLCPETELPEDHGEVGFLIAHCFDFPEELSTAIAYHHRPWEARTEVALVSILYFANEIVNQREISEENLSRGAAYLGLSTEELKGVIKATQDMFQKYLENLRCRKR